MLRQHHQLDGHAFEQTLGESVGQGSFACYSPWGCKESDLTQQLNNNSNGLRSPNIQVQKFCMWNVITEIIDQSVVYFQGLLTS